MSTQRIRNKYSSGLTLVEVLVVAPIVVLVIGAFIGTIVYLTGDVISSRVSNYQAYSIQDALDRIEQDVKLSTQFLATNNISPIRSPQGSNDGSTAFNNVGLSQKPALILNMFALSKNPTDESRNILYIPNTPNSCTSGQVDQNTPLMFNVVYFVKNNTLVRRVVADQNYDANDCDPSTQLTSSSPWQLPSCTPGYSDPFCKTNDEILVTGLVSDDSFLISYFTAGNIDNLDDASDPNILDASTRQSSLDLADQVSVTINTTITAAGRDIDDSGTIRATKYNLKDL